MRSDRLGLALSHILQLNTPTDIRPTLATTINNIPSEWYSDHTPDLVTV